MLTHITVKNFRGFENLEISGLKRLNIFTGLNGTGKTTVLEIPFVIGGAGNTNVVFTVHFFRRDPRLTLQSDEVFKDLFYGRNTKNRIELNSTGGFHKGSARARRKLRITAIPSDVVAPQTSASEVTLQGLAFDFDGPTGKSVSKVLWESVYESPLPGAEPQLTVRLRADNKAVREDTIFGIFASPYKPDLIEQSHDQLVELVKKRNTKPLIRCLSLIAPGLEELVPLTENGRKNIYANLGQGTLLPSHLLGAGFFNFLNVALDIYSTSDGIIIIDEIESGLHHTIQKKYFEFLITEATKRNIQLYVATHSNEALSNLAEACKDLKFNDLALFRLRRQPQKSLIASYDFDTFIDSFKLDIDLRG